MSYYIKVSKVDYYQWKIGAIALFICCLGFIYVNQHKVYPEEINDEWWHKGYQDCQAQNSQMLTDVQFSNQSCRLYVDKAYFAECVNKTFQNELRIGRVDFFYGDNK